MRCGGACVDTRTDRRHCGGCDRPCGAGLDCAGGRCSCVKGGSCAGCCADGACVPLASQTVSRCGRGGASCVGCDDGLSCTSDACASGACTGTAVPGKCVILGACVADGEFDPSDACRTCDSARNPYAYTPAQISGCMWTLSGSGAAGMTDGPLDVAQFAGPRGLAVDAKGRIYVAEAGNDAIRVIDNSTVTTLAGGASGHQDGPAATARFRDPTGVAVDPAGSVVYVADTKNHCIRKIAAGQVSTLAGVPGKPGLVDGAAGQARFYLPHGLALAGGALYVADRSNHVIRRVAAGSVTTHAGSGVSGARDGALLQARFHRPLDIHSGADGALYVADSYRVVRLSGGKATTLAGGPKPGYTNGPAANAYFHVIAGVVRTASGAIFISEGTTDRLRVLDGGVVSTVSDGGGYIDGELSKCRVSDTWGIVEGAGGRVIFADSGNHSIRVFLP